MSKETVYTDAVCADMRERYEAAEDDDRRALVVKAVAAELGVNVASVRAKMVRGEYYISKTYKTKTGEKSESKEVIVESIAKLTGTEADKLTGLEKANKATLVFIRAFIRAAAEVVFDEADTATETEGDPEPEAETV